MKVTQNIVLTLFLLTGSATAVAASSSLTLQYGPSFPSPVSPLSRTQPAYDFEVSQFWHPNANTLLEISVTEHMDQSGYTPGPGEICACISWTAPPRVSTFTFGMPSPVPVAMPFGYQIFNSYNPMPFNFDATIDNMWFIGGFSTVQIGEMETQVNNGVETLTRFAADFKVQFGETSFVEAIDPSTGFSSFTQEFTAYPGNWFAGSLRYQSDTAAFAYLAPVPEASTYGMLLTGLGLVGTVARRRKLAEA